MVPPRALAVAVAAAAFAAGCRGDRRAPAEPPPSASAPSATAAPAEAQDASFDLLEHLDACEVRHRGLSLDLGTPAVHALNDFAFEPDSAVEEIEQGGATYARLRRRELRLTFWLDAAIDRDLLVGLRGRAGTGRSVTVLVDGRPLGAAKLPDGTPAVVSLAAAEFALSRGRHTLLLKFAGPAPNGREFFADIDWIRIGVRDEHTATYSAPTLEDIRADFELSGTPRRSIVLRAPGGVRCPVRPAPGALLRVALGYWGDGSGTAEVRVLEDGVAPITLQQRHVVGGAGAQWVPLEIDLGRFSGRVVAIDLRALRTEGGGRVVFGEPRLVRRPGPVELVPEAKTVVVVLASALDRRRIPPWGPIGTLTAIGEIARSGLAYSDYRVPTTLPAGVVATLLTGLHPRSHRLEDPAARLAPGARTLGSALKAVGGRTAFFTGVPTTFAPFGFEQGWDRFAAFSPVHDVAATEPLDEATRWLERRLRAARREKQLVVVHLRGAHPPWDLTRDEVARLPPEEYGGAIDARRGGIVLGQIRARQQVTARRLTAEEWVRLRALEDAALVKQNDAIQRLIDTLRREDAWDETLFVFAGDVAQGDPPRVPYDPSPPLAEDRLVTPLLVKYPGARRGGTETNVLVTTADLAVTTLRAFRLEVPAQLEGHDLFALAAEQGPVAGRLLYATFGSRYASRAGSWLLLGAPGKVPSLCQLDVDPACTTDLFDSRPIVAQALWRWTFLAERAAARPDRRAAPREPAAIDPDLAASLIVWGDVQ